MACPCPCCGKTGACCVGAVCTQETCADCEALGGLWQGTGVPCDGADCPCDPPADHTVCEKCLGGVIVDKCPGGSTCCDGVCCDKNCCNGVCQEASCACCANVYRYSDPEGVVHPPEFADVVLTSEYTISTETCPPGIPVCCSRSSPVYCYWYVDEVNDECPAGWDRTSPYGFVSDTLCYFYAESPAGDCDGIVEIPDGYTYGGGGAFVIYERGEWQDPCEEPPP